MSNLLYLGAAVVISAVGCAVIYLRNRKPHSLESGIEAFRRELDALAPERRERPGADRDRRPRS